MTDAAPSAVLLVAHGSRLEASNCEVEALAGRLAGHLPGRVVSHAFLELARPSIPDAIDALVRSGARHIVLIPYFLSAGRHVATDIPSLVEAARNRHPGLRIDCTDHFGAVDGVPDLLAEMVPGIRRA